MARFDAACMSSDGGLLALREVEQRLAIASRLAGCIRDPRDPSRVIHGLDEIIRTRMLMIAAGYEDGNDADTLRRDPMFKLAMGRLPDDADLCSQPTISRLENLPDARALLRMGRAMVDHYCQSFRQVPRRIVLDVDDTFDAVHGGQQLRLFNAHHDEYGFQPIVVFDGDGRMIAAVLRPASRPSGKQIVRRPHLEVGVPAWASAPHTSLIRAGTSPGATLLVVTWAATISAVRVSSSGVEDGRTGSALMGSYTAERDR